MWWRNIVWMQQGQFYEPASKPLSGKGVVIIGGGPGLDMGTVRKLHSSERTILTNNAFEIWKHSCPLVALDRRWWGWHGASVKDAGHLAVSAIRPGAAIHSAAEPYCFEKQTSPPFTEDVHYLCGKNSGHGAAHFAYHLGASRIYLAGFDMGFVNGRSHWHDGHRVPSTEANYVTRFRPELETLCQELHKRGVILSAITPTAAKIPTTPIEMALEDLT